MTRAVGRDGRLIALAAFTFRRSRACDAVRAKVGNESHLPKSAAHRAGGGVRADRAEEARPGLDLPRPPEDLLDFPTSGPAGVADSSFSRAALTSLSSVMSGNGSKELSSELAAEPVPGRD